MVGLAASPSPALSAFVTQARDTPSRRARPARDKPSFAMMLLNAIARSLALVLARGYLQRFASTQTPAASAC